MKTKLRKCDKCNEETIQSSKKVLSSAKLKIRRTIDRCFKCGNTTIKGKRTYTKKLGGNSL